MDKVWKRKENEEREKNGAQGEIKIHGNGERRVKWREGKEIVCAARCKPLVLVMDGSRF